MTSPLRLLVVKLHSLGDLVILTPALRRLREGLPDASIDLLTAEWSAPAVMHNPNIDGLLVRPDKEFFGSGLSRATALSKLVISMRRRSYDAAVVFHKHPMIDRMTAAFGIRSRFRFADAPLGVPVTSNPPNRFPLDERRHSAVTAWQLADLAVEALGGGKADRPDLSELTYDWGITDGEKNAAQEILSANNLKMHEFAVVLPGGAKNPHGTETVRRWSTEKFAELVEYISNKLSLRVVLTGVNSDILTCREVSQRTKAKVIDITGQVGIRDTAAIMALSRVVVANDSGPLHVAAAVGVPVVGIFGPTGISAKLPPSPTARGVTLGLPCSPCYFGVFKGCIFDRIRCMDELTVEAVAHKVKEAVVC